MTGDAHATRALVLGYHGCDSDGVLIESVAKRDARSAEHVDRECLSYESQRLGQYGSGWSIRR